MCYCWQVRVLHVDTGKEALVPLNSFFDLPPKARQAQELPFQARPAHMYGVSHHSFVNSTKALEVILSQATQVCVLTSVNRVIIVNALIWLACLLAI